MKGGLRRGPRKKSVLRLRGSNALTGIVQHVLPLISVSSRTVKIWRRSIFLQHQQAGLGDSAVDDPALLVQFYNLTGANQSESIYVNSLTTATYHLNFQNDGNTAERSLSTEFGDAAGR